MTLRSRSLEDLARYLYTASKEREKSQQALASLEFLERFAAFSDQPGAIDELSELLEREDEGLLALLKLPLTELGLVPSQFLSSTPCVTGRVPYGRARTRERTSQMGLRLRRNLKSREASAKEEMKEACALIAGKRRMIDLLFLSHFDSDHVSGIATLAKRAKVGTVVIPYLDELDRIAILAHASATGKLTSTLVGAVSDPPSWFRGRGAMRVVEIGQGGPSTRSVFVSVDPGLPPDTGDARFGDAILIDPKGQVVSLPTEGTSRVEAGLLGNSWVKLILERAGEWCFFRS